MIVYHSKNVGDKFLLKLKKELQKYFKDCKKIAIKIHFGEPGNKYALKPQDVNPITDLLKELNIDFFLYDSSVAYGGPRGKPETHKEAAIKKGWDKLGEIKTDDNFVKVKGKNMSYEVCKSLADADGVLIISHIKGHICAGFGGAIKNLGMGSMTKKTKGKIHSGGEPLYVGECTQCKTCEKSCPLGTIKVMDKPIFGTCYGCSNCIYVCPVKALKPKKDYFDTLLAEGASLSQKKFKKFYYVNILKRITKECDCEKNPKKIIAKDDGVLMSKDGVAIDKASYDIVKKMNGDVFLKYNKKSGLHQIKAAEKIKMGSSKYSLKEL